MMLTSLVLAAAAQDAPAAAPQVAASAPAPAAEWSAPAVHVAGYPYVVEVSLTADGPLETWRLEPAAFTVDGKPLGERGAVTLDVPAGARLSVSFDLAAALPAEGSFQVGYADSDRTVAVKAYTGGVARGELDFMAMEPAELAQYRVLLDTNRGPILVELWPDVAPGHVRNYLDLADQGFYDGVLFHRVSPSFMIQGGDPNTRERPNDRSSWGSGNGPRRLQAEFSDKNHVPGVLSAARTADPNSASCQFFIMTAPATHLDGQYSAFGKVLDGMDAVMAIARAKGQPFAGATMPDEPQRIDHAYVLRAE